MTANSQSMSVAKKDAAEFLSSDSIKAEVAKLASKQTPERITRVATTAIMSKGELIQAANHPVGKASILNALMRCTQMGLEPDGRLAHLIPYWSSEHKCYIVQLIVDYKGLLQMAKDNGIDAKAILVHSHDAFEYLEDDGTGKTVVNHSFEPFQDRGKIIGVYSRATEAGKAPDYEAMSIDEVESIRARSRAKDSGPWKTDYGEMVKKTVLRRHSKRWPLKPETREAFNADDDTPPPMPETPTFAKPIFSKPQEEAQVLPPPELGLPEENPPPAPAPTPIPEEVPFEALPATTPAPVNPVKQLRAMCRELKLREPDLLGFLVELGEQKVDSLEHLALVSPDTITRLLKPGTLADIAKKLKEGQKK